MTQASPPVGSIWKYSAAPTICALSLLLSFSLYASNEAAPALPEADHYSALLEQIDTLEAEQGAFSPYLGEASQKLAKRYFEQQQYQQAAEYFNRALFIERVNHGIYSDKQKPLLAKLVRSLEAQNKWPEAFAKQQYAHWLFNRHYKNDSLTLLNELKLLADWHIKAYIKTEKNNYQHLLEAQKLYLQCIKTHDRNNSSDDIRLIPILQGLLNATYYLASNYHDTVDTSVGVRFGDNKQAIDRQSQINQYYMRSYQDGKKFIYRIESIYQANDLLEPKSTLTLQMLKSDWDQLFGKSHAAERGYIKVYRKAEAGQQDAEALFSQPVMLPKIEHQLRQAGSQTNTYSVVKFDVSYNGLAKNIEITETVPAKNKSLSRLTKKFLRSVRFRPAIKNGKPVTVKDLSQRYNFP